MNRSSIYLKSYLKIIFPANSQHRYNVAATSQRRCNDVVATLYVRWVYMYLCHEIMCSLTSAFIEDLVQPAPASDQSLRCPHEEHVNLWLSKERVAITLKSLRGRACRSESSLGVHFKVLLLTLWHIYTYLLRLSLIDRYILRLV